ncbi:hypothetical protein QVD17_04042 [Tagetes erecta]|uniref:Replication protein A subunit n=1 Tax=Tagetes erecta TaxID=13708 RepID=A0AAD8LFU9_TARER|nr:hypothetical protein QVD17_04042 [Tagetes erecta]
MARIGSETRGSVVGCSERYTCFCRKQGERGSIVQLNDFMTSEISNRKIVVILAVDIIMSNCDIIGDAKPFSPTPMQSINRPTTMGGPQNIRGSVPGPNFGVNPPNHPSRQGHNASLHSYPTLHASTMLSRPPANTYVRPVQPTRNQPPPMYMNRGPTARNEAPPRIIPIAALNPYQGRWTIKARVTAKAELRHYHNAKGDGKVFSFDLLDSAGGEIRATCFNAVADQLYDQIEAGKVYFVSKGNIKPAQKAFNHLKNDHEITLDHTSTLDPCLDDDRSIPPQQFHFRSIAEIENMDSNTILDIIGVVYSIKPSSTITTKKGTETQKRTLSLKDMSERSVEVTLWGNFCSKGQTLQNMCDSGIFPVLAIKATRVSEFNGKSVGTISTSQLFIEPDLPETRELKTWYDNVGKNTPTVSLSHDTIARTDVCKTVSQIKDEKLGTNEKPDWITVNATLFYMKPENFCYTSCPLMLGDRKCTKKVTNNGDGKWQCDRCNETVDQCEYRYILQLQLQDHTGSTWATAFQEIGEEVMGISAKDLYYIRHEEQDEERFTDIVRNAIYTKYIFKLKVKEETFGDEARVKSTIVKVEKIKASSDTTFLLGLLKKEDPKIGFSIAASAPSNTFMGSVVTASGVGQQASLPASETGHYGSQYGGSRHGVGQQASLPTSEAGQYVNQYGSRHASLPASEAGQYGKQYGSSRHGVGQQVNLPASETGQYGNQYGGSRHGVNCNSCGGVGHSSMNCPSAVNCSGGRFSVHSVGENNANVSSPHGVNVAPARYGRASGQYVGGY